VDLGINLGFAFKRWPEPERWATIVRDDLGLDLVQFTFDLLDPWWPERERHTLAARVRRAAADAGLTIHSAQLGLAWYTYNGLLHPDPAGRAIALDWWRRASETAAEIGAPAVGGPLGALSVAEADDAALRAVRYTDMLDDVVAASDAAAAAGLQALLVEPTPLPREIPHTIGEARRLASDLRDRTAVPIRWVIDVGHALYRPLYGEDVDLIDWLDSLRDDIALLHLQNHDFQSDAHWGWPDDRGLYDVAAFVQTVRNAGLADVPVVIELFYPFELPDDAVLASIRSTVRHCQEVLALNAASHSPGPVPRERGVGA
jgi:D-erythrulose 1-phosphate 3-epimerase